MTALFRAFMFVLVAAGSLVLPLAEQLDLQQQCEASDVEDGEELEDDVTALRWVLAVSSAVALERPEPLWSYDGDGEREANAARLLRPPRRA